MIISAFSSIYQIASVLLGISYSSTPFLGSNSVLAWAAITKCHKLSGLSTTKTYFSQFWRLGHIRSRCQLIWCLMRALFLVARCWLLCVSPHRKKRVNCPLAPSYKDINPTKGVPFSWPNYLPKTPFLNTITLMIQHMNFGEEKTFSPKCQFSINSPQSNMVSPLLSPLALWLHCL